MRCLRWQHTLLAVFGAWLVGHEIQVLALPQVSLGPVRTIHIAGLFVVAVVCVLGGVKRPRERAAWACFAAAIVSWTVGECYFAVVLWDASDVPVPSWADAGYLGTYPLLFAGLILLARARRHERAFTLWIDGLTAALALGALSAAVVFQAVKNSVGGHALAVATNLAYPLGDLVLLGLLAAVVALQGWRLDRSTGVLACGLLLFWIADSIFLVQQARGTYVAGGWVDIGWWGGLLLLPVAAWARQPSSSAAVRRSLGTGAIAIPAAFALAGVGLLVFASFHRIAPLSVALAGTSMVLVVLRLVVTFRHNVAVMRASQREALSDALTGLGNRRLLVADLSDALEQADLRPPLTLVLFDLDGFKHYNDSFGHPAGDALLIRLGSRLSASLGTDGTGYRMGGDEFCALIRASDELGRRAVKAAAAALHERGEGFAIGASWGMVGLPREATSVEDALRVADGRMYAHKRSGRPTAGREFCDLLVTVLAERTPELRDHSRDVADLAELTARELGLGHDDASCLRHAAELHDVGKIAIPDAILDKPGPLDPDEWAFMRRHTLIGERIIRSAPSLSSIAPLVRSSHERFDGSGYPDGLLGAAIPLGARILAVCDSFDAMTSARPYQAARSCDAALIELTRCAGTQFDADVVTAFMAAVRALERARAIPIPDRVAEV